MKKYIVFLLCLFLFMGCSMFNQRMAEMSRIERDNAIKNMKFTGNGDQITADINCKKYVDENIMSLAATGNFYGFQARYLYQDCMIKNGFTIYWSVTNGNGLDLYQDCMIKNGFTCTADCAYNAK